MRSFTQAKYTFTCLLACVSASAHALTPPRTVNLFDQEALAQIVSIAQQKVSKAKAADRCRWIGDLAMWRDPDITPLVQDFREAFKKGSNNKRARLGQDDAEATPAPDIQALMGFDPGARSLGGYTIRRPDGQSVSGVLAKCGYTATPSFRVNMSAASFKTTSLEALKQSIRFVHENIVQIINEGTRKCIRRASFANHRLRQKHFARAGRQLLDDLGGSPPEPSHLEVAYGAALFDSAGTPSCAPYRHFARALPGIMLRHNVVVTVTMVSEFRTSIVCPYCKAHFRRVVHTHRTTLCQNPACEGAPWPVERLRRHPEQRDMLLNLSHRDKSASENILWCTFDVTSDQIEQSPFHYDSQRGALPRYH
ncbi:hypothetical protein J8273_1977 [Carpediemonas membranifera]|uniref:Uncharacterized protein n=1 Tax=Carpediemonas membranifera TaxID=201153 RepID=A0A8J6E493_9EUKA|nr:hypothetical protein J8273_1977 [Carpediemonas membranifera]|eukprot:KAG9396923.1 hypothetical protein J8273_1977 [Carpediemonas membranifera]